MNGTNKKPSNKGGVAARLGFKYQDHVAAQFVIRMIDNQCIKQVECETSDDITIIWTDGENLTPEYIQVKTTDNDKKWSLTEICQRSGKKVAGKLPPNSLADKSLLCDSNEQPAKFRIVSIRDIGPTIHCLKIELVDRHDPKPIKELASKMLAKIKTNSANGNGIGYWVENTVWQITGDAEALIAKNHKRIYALAEKYGTNTSSSHLDSIYEDLLRLVIDAAEASNITNPKDKIISRQAALDWWGKHLAVTDAAIKKTSKPYRVETDAFFAEIINLNEETILRAIAGYDAQYEMGKWRTDQLAEYLADWLPEVALKASELVQVTHMNMREKLRAAMKKIKAERAINSPKIVAELLLHAILRHHFSSEPIACKIFYQTAKGLGAFGNAHIVRTNGKDELWLGLGTLTPVKSYDQAIDKVMKNLTDALKPDFLKEEREVIITLREPQHLLPTTLEDAFKKNTPIDKLLSVLTFTILIGYDSHTLGEGYNDKYKEKLLEEVKSNYESIKPKLPTSFSAIKVQVFLIPIESIADLFFQFEKKIAV